jgi:hypothetical protein
MDCGLSVADSRVLSYWEVAQYPAAWNEMRAQSTRHFSRLLEGRGQGGFL